MKKSVKVIISVFVVIVLCAGGYVADMFGVFAKGNGKEYGLSNTALVENSPLGGKTAIFLGRDSPGTATFTVLDMIL